MLWLYAFKIEKKMHEEKTKQTFLCLFVLIPAGSPVNGEAASPPPATNDNRHPVDSLDTIILQLRQVTRERDELRKRLALASPGTTFDDCRCKSWLGFFAVPIVTAILIWTLAPSHKGSIKLGCNFSFKLAVVTETLKDDLLLVLFITLRVVDLNVLSSHFNV